MNTIKKNKDMYTIEEIKQLEIIKSKYETLLETIPAMSWFMDLDGNYQNINREFSIHSGKSKSEIIGKGHKNAWPLKIGNECEQNDNITLEKKSKMSFEEEVPGINGYKKFEIYRSPVVDIHNDLIGIMAVARDITKVEEVDNKFKILMENIPFEVWQLDIYGNLVNANKKYASAVNRDLQDIIGKNIDEFYCESDVQIIKSEDAAIIKSKQPLKVAQKIKSLGKERFIEIYKTPIINRENEVTGIVGILIDTTEINEAKEEIKKQTYMDYSTGLLNRRALYELINSEFKHKPKTTILIDVDNFKYINDTYGHVSGDEVLFKIAQILKSSNQDGKVFRFGGDEFLIILDSELDLENIILKAEDIINKVSSITIHNENIEISMGISTNKYISEGEENRSIIEADMALYKAKTHKKSNYVLYTKELEEEIIFAKNLEKDLNMAIDNDEINLFYQPQYNSNNKIIGFEALFRWNNEKYSKVPVYKIIDFMENNKSIIKIGKEIIRKACVFAKKINEDKFNKIVVSFNVSPVQIMSDTFIDDIKSIISETNIKPEWIAIEITENIMLDNMSDSILKINELSSLGIEIALDDFGTGYSSFNYLVKLPLSKVKIDKSFSMEMKEYKEYINLIKLIVDASHSLNLNVVAEGVETKEQLNVLKSMGVEYMQGYLFSKPIKESDALKLLK